jgi:tungstate transport system substrate-binding protein
VQLDVLSEGDPGLLNVYHVIEMTTRAGDRVNTEGAAAFADWIVSPPAQQLIGEFGRDRFGQPLFTPDAGRPDPSAGG